MKELDFNSDPEDFPECWESGEDDIIVELQPIINKHVWLALKEHVTDCKPMFQIQDDGSPILYSIFADGDAERGGDLALDWAIEPLVMALEADFYDDEELLKAAESFKRCAEHLISLIKKDEGAA
jgi:hypothetical protein